MLGKVPVDASDLTTNLSEAERETFINNYWKNPDPVDLKREDCPVSENNRLWLEDACLLLLDFFGKESVRQRKVLRPDYSDFPLRFDGTEESAVDAMNIVAAQMEVPLDSIKLGFYDDRVSQVSTGSPYGGRIFLESDKGDPNSAGLYWGQGEDGRYEIWLNRKELTEPESMVATLAHEIAHIKLLGESRIEENDEHLTDLTTVIFGLGIFNANESFRTYTTNRSYGWRRQGYLSQMQWGYALALFAYIRDEKPPSWINHLTPNVKSAFLKGQRFIEANPELVFQIDRFL
jgi:hypothetical protein